jgi:hypothetical protein
MSIKTLFLFIRLPISMLCSELPQPATEQVTAAAGAGLNPLPDTAAGVRPAAEAALSPSSPPLEEGGGDQMEEREAAGQSGPDLEEVANSLPMMAATNAEAEQTKGCRAVFCCSEMCS